MCNNYVYFGASVSNKNTGKPYYLDTLGTTLDVGLPDFLHFCCREGRTGTEN